MLAAAHGSLSKPSPKPLRLIGKPMPSSGVWKMMKVDGLAGAHLVDQVVVHDHFGDAAVRQAAHEAGAADVAAVDLEAEPRRQQHAERSDHPHQPALLIGGLQHDDGEADIGPVLGGHALHQRALLALSAGRRVAADLPVAMHRAHRALRRGVSRRTSRSPRSKIGGAGERRGDLPSHSPRDDEDPRDTFPRTSRPQAPRQALHGCEFAETGSRTREPAYMVSATVSRSRSRSSHCGRAKDARLRARAAGRRRRQRRVDSDECIAAGRDLWFEGLGFPRPAEPAKDQIRGKTRPATGSVGRYRFAQTCVWQTCLPSGRARPIRVATV